MRDTERESIIKGKKLLNKPIDEWIQVFNARTEEELDMIRSDNPGIREAIQTIKEYGLRRVARAHYESWMKAKRDQYAIEKYIKETAREEGLAKGKAEGLEIGKAKGREEGIKALIESLQEFVKEDDWIKDKLMEKFDLSQEQAEEYITKYRK